MPENATVFVVGDDTLLARRGLKVFGTGMHRDPVLSSKSHVTTRWGQCWVVVGVVIESRHVPGRRFVLPVLARLYLNTKSAEKWKRPYQKKTDLLVEMLTRLDEHARSRACWKAKTLHFLGDSAYTAPVVLAQMPPHIEVTGRVVADSRIHRPAPERAPGTNGRPRIRGERLPSPIEMLQEANLPVRTLAVYSKAYYRMRIARARGRFYKAPQRDVLVIAVAHLTGGREIEVFYTTAMLQPGRQAGSLPHCLDVLRRYSWR